MQENENDKSSLDAEELLRVARERFRLAEEAESEIRALANEDDEFAAGNQWPLKQKSDREEDGRPCLTINRLPQNIHQITNDQKQNKPAIKVSPVDSRADKETAEVFQGIIRHIEYSSNADVAYSRGFNSQVRGGLGFWRIVTEYCDPYSFDQEIRIKSILNRNSAYLDPHYQEPDGSDANWGFVFDDMSKDDFESQFPKAEASSMGDWGDLGKNFPGWFSEKSVRIAEYFYKEFQEITLVHLNNGQVLDKKELPDQMPEGIEVVAERRSIVPKIKWLKINGFEILEETDWPGIYIPIVPCLGDELVVNGKRIVESLIRHAKDPQRMYNYWASAETEAIALAPRTPWIVAEGQVEDYEDQWQTANRKNHAFLPYKPTDLNGTPVPPPQRNSFEPAVGAITNARAASGEDLKATLGIYDAALGNRSNEQSGIAIRNRTAQVQTANFHFIDNLNKSIRHTGRILLDLIPKIYDVAREVRILGEDGQAEVVRVNQEYIRNGQKVHYNLSVGKYDVTISSGPSYETRRQEAADSMMDFTKAMPQTAAYVADLIARYQDWPGSDEFADRLKKTLPPGIADDDKNQLPIPPQVQAQLQQMNQVIDQLTQHLNEKTHLLETKAIEIKSRERIEMSKIELQASAKLAELQSKEAITLLNHQVQQIRQRIDMLGMNQPLDDEDENQNGAGPQMAQPPNVQQQQPQPTGGPAPGQTMGV